MWLLYRKLRRWFCESVYKVVGNFVFCSGWLLRVNLDDKVKEWLLVHLIQQLQLREMVVLYGEHGILNW